MRCEERRGDLVAYLYGELEGHERRALEEHLASCSDCEGELAELAAASGAIRAWHEREEPWSVAQGSGAEVRRARGSSRLASWWRAGVLMPRWGMAGLAAAAVALVVVGAHLDVARSGRGFTVSWGKAANPMVVAPAGLAGLPPAAGGVAQAVPAAADSGTLAQVAAIVARSEERERLNTAELVQALGNEYARRAEDSRREDLRQVDAWMGDIAGRTQQEFARTNDRIAQMAELIVSAKPGGLEPGYRGMPYVREGRLEPGTTGSELPKTKGAPPDSSGAK